MKTIVKQLILFGLILIYGSTHSQEHVTPTLQVGIEGVNLDRGDLDAELILQIIAEKQEEIKTKVIEKMILGKIYESEIGSGLLYNYSANVLTAFLEEPNPKVRTRIILENSVNAVVAYYFANEFYKNPANRAKLKELLTLYKLDESQANFQKLTANNILSKYGGLTFENTKSDTKYTINNDEILAENNPNHILSLLIDISGEVIRENQTLKKLGIMKIAYSRSYQYSNQYIKLLENDSKTTDEDPRAKIAKEIFNLMKSQLNQMVGRTAIGNYIINNQDKLDLIINETYLLANNRLDTLPFLKHLDLRLDESIIDGMSEITKEEYFSTVYELSKDLSYLKNALIEINSNTNKNDVLNKIKLYGQLVLNIQKEIIPDLKIAVKYNPEIIETINFLETICLDLGKILKEDNLIKDLIDSPFLDVATKVYELDDVHSYIELITYLGEIESAFGNQNISYGLSLVNSFINDYVTLKEENGKEYITVDVESLLSRMSNVKPDAMSRWQFHFTVGANNANFINGIDMENNNPLVNYSFVGEKIGLKYLVYTPGSWKTRHPGETYFIGDQKYMKKSAPSEPIVSNYHFLAYGSGLLYNIVNTGTTKDFTSPLFGIGAGMTFYNSLDFNLSWGVPATVFSESLFQDKLVSFVNIGFDIQFNEYIKRFNKKQKAKKRQDLILEAKQNKLTKEKNIIK